jgi:cytochrome c oxidase assembly protein subunit 11
MQGEPASNIATPDRLKARSNAVVAASCIAFFGGMIGLSYAAVPLYQMFCQVTGFGGTPMLASQAPDTVLDRVIHIRFDANTSAGVPWAFAPKQREVKLRLGETMQIEYLAKNLSNRAAAGTATFNVTPASAGAYFNKMQCFCFTDTTLQPGEAMEMPVVFFVDPEIVNDPEASKITTITLSYTFFPTDLPEGAKDAEAANLIPPTDKPSDGRL